MSAETCSNQALDEICQFSGYATAPEQGAWLIEHGMLPVQAAGYELVTERPWEMPGSESYIMQFAVGADGLFQRFIAKACTKVPVLPSLGDWLTRRELLMQHDLAVPRLYAVNRGVLIEEYIPSDLRTAFLDADMQGRMGLREQFINTYRRVYELGFRPISMHDVRSRGEDIVLVDFGSDLGGIQTNSLQYDSTIVDQFACTEFQRLVG